MRGHPAAKVLTVSADTQNKQLAEKQGLAFLAKPFAPATMVSRVREMLEAKSA